MVYADSVTKIRMVTLSKDIDRIKPSKANGSLQLTALKLKLIEMYNQIYEIGILDQNFINNSNSSKKKSLKILKNNIGKETQITSLFSLKSAYNEIKVKLDELKGIYPEWSSWLENFQPESYLVSNLIPDAERNRQMEQKLLENLSTNRGIVQEGERIISQGDIVSAQTFNILESFRITFEKNRGENSKYILVIVGRAVMAVMLLLTLYLFLLNIRRKVIRSKRDISFIMITLTAMIVCC